MLETEAELDALQELLDRSRSGATEHLRGIIDDQRALSATDIVGLLQNMKVLSLATVTARGEPRISAVDGHFLHGTWTWSTDGPSAKARRPRGASAVSVAQIDNEELAVFAHGAADRLHPRILSGTRRSPTGRRATELLRSTGARTSAFTGWRRRGWWALPPTARNCWQPAASSLHTKVHFHAAMDQRPVRRRQIQQRELHSRLPGSLICDPELLGFGLHRMLPPQLRGDFQDSPPGGRACTRCWI